MIDWTKVQSALTRAGYPCGRADGVPGIKTWTALFAYAAHRAEDAVIADLGRAGVAWLTDHAIAQTPARLAEFIAQCANETGGFTRFDENLNYSIATIMRVWPSRFPTTTAARMVAGKPQALAEAAYGGRMGNDKPGDGWRYRGRGMLQLTGKENYARFGPLIGIDLVAEPDEAADPSVSLVIAMRFWEIGRVNDAVDKGDFLRARRITNGGRIGLEEVAVRRARLLTVLA